MKLSEIIPSRFYSFVYDSEAKLLKGGKANANILYGKVTKRAVYAGQAASAEMYVNASLKNNPAWQPSADYTPRFQQTENPCVVASVSNSGALQCRILNPRTVKLEYYVAGVPATPEQLKVIKQYKPARKASNGVKVMFPYVENLANVDIDEIPETETDED